MAGALYLVATPIGNLADISARCTRTLSEADFIAAEDTRVTMKLLNHLQLKKPLVSYYAHNRKESGERILERLLNGETCALVSDAGMPAISDPGEELVAMCAAREIPVFCIPGPAAAVTALAVSGLPTQRFTFEGFLSTAKKRRFGHLHELKTEKRTMIFYEAPHKLLPTLTDMLAVWGDRRVSISRELTKLYEETLRTTLAEAVDHFSRVKPRGEFVLVIEGAAAEETGVSLEAAVAWVQALHKDGAALKDAAKLVSAETAIPKNTLYAACLSLEEA